MKKVLVTGGAGFIGRSLVRLLAEAGYSVVALDSFRFSNQTQLFNHPEVSWIEGDTRDWDQVFNLVSQSDGVIHLAAPSSFLMHEEDDLEACDFTMRGFKTVIEAVRRSGLKKLVWASTSAVYEEWQRPPRVPFQEDMPLNPPDSKAGCKHWCELEAQRYANRYGVTSIAFRPFSVYGVGEHTKGGYANVTSLFTWAMMAGHQPIIWGDGSQTRDLIFVEDAARAFLLALEANIPTQALNLGYGVEHSFNDIIAIIGRVLKITPEPIYVDVPIQIYAQRLWADTDRIQSVLGFQPKVSLEEGIRQIVAATQSLSDSVRYQLSLDMQQHYFEKLKNHKPV